MNIDTTMPVTPAMFGGNGGFMGGGSSEWIVFLIIAMIFGGNGNGLFGNRGNGAIAENSYIANEFNYSNLSNGIRGLERGLCDTGYALNSSINSQGELTRGAVTQANYALERTLDGISGQIASCCCDTNRNLDSLRYETAKQTCDIITAGNLNTRDLIEAGNANTQRIVDMMTQNEIQALRDKNTALTLQVSQSAQTQAIIDSLKPCPRPAYITANPYCGV